MSVQDHTYQRAVGIIVLSRSASTCHLQRVLEVPYADAVHFMERAEGEGVVSAPDERGRRVVLAKPPVP